ncbi:MAG: hypothetical protein WAK29_20140 [Terriglobales bacterium]
MRLYSASSEETLRARKFLRDWAGEGLLGKAQYQVLEQETITELRTTNIFLRLVLFLFTMLSVGAAFGLFLVLLSRPSNQTAGVVALIFAAVCYAAAEVAVSRVRLYHYGIEEALVVCSVGFLCAGLEAVFFGGRIYSPNPEAVRCLVPAAGAAFSLWIWRRFGFWYAFVAAMTFVIFLPGNWTSSHTAQRLIVAAIYATGLAVVAMALRSRHRFDYLDEAYSLAEAFLWLGVYLVLNLQLSSFNVSERWWGGNRAASEYTSWFYWGTWVLIWCLPAIVLGRGIRRKGRFVLAVGAIITVLTFVSNKPYLGWPRHTWDPMILGIVLTGVAVWLRRWLVRGPGGIRHGFTAARLTGKDKLWLNVGSTVLGPLPHSITPAPQTGSQDFHFGGGQTGGGGAGGDF